MKSLEERQAHRIARHAANTAPHGAHRDTLQASAEEAVALKDAEAGLKSAPLAAKEAKSKGKPKDKAVDPFKA